MRELTDFQRRKLRHLFDIYDVERNGFLERADYELRAHTVATLWGHEPGSREHEEITRHYLTHFERIKAVADFSRDGRIEVDEWLDFFEIVLSDDVAFEAVVGATAKLVFDGFDFDGNGVIDRDELASLRRAFGLDDSHTDLIFAALDLNGDGVLSVDEVHQAIGEFFRSNDPDAPGNHFFGPLES